MSVHASNLKLLTNALVSVLLPMGIPLVKYMALECPSEDLSSSFLVPSWLAMLRNLIPEVGI